MDADLPRDLIGASFCGLLRWHRNEARLSGAVVQAAFPSRVTQQAKIKDHAIILFSRPPEHEEPLQRHEVRLGVSGGKWRISGATALMRTLSPRPELLKHVALWRARHPEDRLILALPSTAAEGMYEALQTELEPDVPKHRRQHKRQARQERNRQLRQQLEQQQQQFLQDDGTAASDGEEYPAAEANMLGAGALALPADRRSTTQAAWATDAEGGVSNRDWDIHSQLHAAGGLHRPGSRVGGGVKRPREGEAGGWEGANGAAKREPADAAVLGGANGTDDPAAPGAADPAGDSCTTGSDGSCTAHVHLTATMLQGGYVQLDAAFAAACGITASPSGSAGSSAPLPLRLQCRDGRLLTAELTLARGDQHAGGEAREGQRAGSEAQEGRSAEEGAAGGGAGRDSHASVSTSGGPASCTLSGLGPWLQRRRAAEGSVVRVSCLAPGVHCIDIVAGPGATCRRRVPLGTDTARAPADAGKPRAASAAATARAVSSIVAPSAGAATTDGRLPEAPSVSQPPDAEDADGGEEATAPGARPMGRATHGSVPGAAAALHPQPGPHGRWQQVQQHRQRQAGPGGTGEEHGLRGSGPASKAGGPRPYSGKPSSPRNGSAPLRPRHGGGKGADADLEAHPSSRFAQPAHPVHAAAQEAEEDENDEGETEAYAPPAADAPQRHTGGAGPAGEHGALTASYLTEALRERLLAAQLQMYLPYGLPQRTATGAAAAGLAAPPLLGPGPPPAAQQLGLGAGSVLSRHMAEMLAQMQRQAAVPGRGSPSPPY